MEVEAAYKLLSDKDTEDKLRPRMKGIDQVASANDISPSNLSTQLHLGPGME
jgi:hypothetical protein